jgi:hypothetical protein
MRGTTAQPPGRGVTVMVGVRTGVGVTARVGTITVTPLTGVAEAAGAAAAPQAVSSKVARINTTGKIFFIFVFTFQINLKP